MYIKHRCNTSADLLLAESQNYSGIECDIRHSCSNIYLSHDPKGVHQSVSSIDILESPFNFTTVILNIKETGIEEQLIIRFIDRFQHLYLLDVPFPEIVSLCKKGYSHHILWRVSEYEPFRPEIPLLLGIKNIWLDSFKSFWFTHFFLDSLERQGFKICLVSPELQSREPVHEITNLFRKSCLSYFDLICTKDRGLYTTFEI